MFTRKVATDVSYLACATKLLAAADVIYPAFATHNAYTIGAIKALAGGREFEFQRLHGMGEQVYETLAEEEGDRPTRVRIYAPVGGHKDLLAYLVRRLLENGANSSFVNRMADADVPVAELVTDPVGRPRRARAAAAIRRSRCRPTSIPTAATAPGSTSPIRLVREPLLAELEALKAREWAAVPTALAAEGGEDARNPLAAGRRASSARRSMPPPPTST